jgi:hypothetical protein
MATPEEREARRKRVLSEFRPEFAAFLTEADLDEPNVSRIGMVLTARWAAAQPQKPASEQPTLEQELARDLGIYGGDERNWRPLIAGAIDRTEPDEEVRLVGTGRRYVHSGMYAGERVTRIRGRFRDGTERDLYLLVSTSVGEDADVWMAIYPSLQALQQNNRWLWDQAMLRRADDAQEDDD